jgi:DNA-binding XRE family transcriptional regulator
MTQETVASALNVSKKTVSRWENGVTMPDVNMVEPICSLYQCSYDDIEWTA